MPPRILCLLLRSPSDDARLARERARLADDFEEFSPLIGWIGGAGAGAEACLALDVGPTSHWFGGEEALLARLAERLRQRGLTCTAALADTLGAAWAVARFGIAHKSPWNRRIVPPGGQASALARLPAAALRIPADVVQVLQELGLYEVGQLLALPRAALAERFAPVLLTRLAQALGDVPELFTSHRPAPAVEAGLSWEGGVTTAEPLLEAWRLLLPRLLEPLAGRGRGVARLLAELHCEAGAQGSLVRQPRPAQQGRLVLGLLRPTLDLGHLLGLLQLRLEAERVRRPVVGTRLIVLEEAPQAVQQQVLFDDMAPPIESQAWAALVERLAGRLGSEAVVRIRPRADHQPERAWQAVPWLGPCGDDAPPQATKLRKRSRVRQPEEAYSAPPRPALLLTQPRPVRVFAVAPHGSPCQFEYEGRELAVVESRGPERIETGWWRGPSVRRDYFRALTADGRRCWLFRDLRRNRWFLHGWFD